MTNLIHTLLNRMKTQFGIFIGSKSVCAISISPVEMLFKLTFEQKICTGFRTRLLLQINKTGDLLIERESVVLYK